MTSMEPSGILALIVVGLIAGWLASAVMHGGFGIIGDIVVGILGAFIGGWLLSALGVAVRAGFLGSIAVAFLGAVVLICLLRLLSGGWRRAYR